MPAFPDITSHLLVGSDPVPQSGIDIERASDGTVRGRRLYPDDIYELDLDFGGLSDTQASSLQSFYSINRDSDDIQITILGVSYRCVFLNRPTISHVATNLNDANVKMTGKVI